MYFKKTRHIITTRFYLYLDLIRFNRPAGWLLLLWPTLAALWIAADGFSGWHIIAVFTLGTILMRSAGCCINDVADRNFDLHVQRTTNRPITSGKISAREALLVGAVLAGSAFLLTLTTNWLVITLSFAALLVAVAYPYAKRYINMPQAVLGLAFSMGIPMAFAAVQQKVPALAYVMIFSNVCWVLAYDTAYAMVDREDDLKIGMKTSAITLGRFDVAFIMLSYGLHIAIWWGIFWCIGSLSNTSWTHWRTIAWGAGLVLVCVQVLWQYHHIRTRERSRCFAAFTQNHWIGFVVFITACALVSI